MARHRNIRKLDYSEDYEEEYAQYGRSLEEDVAVSPSTAAEFMYHRDVRTTPSLGAYLGSGEGEGEGRRVPQISPLATSVAAVTLESRSEGAATPNGRKVVAPPPGFPARPQQPSLESVAMTTRGSCPSPILTCSGTNASAVPSVSVATSMPGSVAFCGSADMSRSSLPAPYALLQSRDVAGQSDSLSSSTPGLPLHTGSSALGRDYVTPSSLAGLARPSATQAPSLADLARPYQQPPSLADFARPSRQVPSLSNLARPSRQPPSLSGLARPSQQPPSLSDLARPSQRVPSLSDLTSPSQQPPSLSGLARPYPQQAPSLSDLARPSRKQAPSLTDLATPSQLTPSLDDLARPSQQAPSLADLARPSAKQPPSLSDLARPSRQAPTLSDLARLSQQPPDLARPSPQQAFSLADLTRPPKQAPFLTDVASPSRKQAPPLADLARPSQQAPSLTDLARPSRKQAPSLTDLATPSQQAPSLTDLATPSQQAPSLTDLARPSRKQAPSLADLARPSQQAPSLADLARPSQQARPPSLADLARPSRQAPSLSDLVNSSPLSFPRQDPPSSTSPTVTSPPHAQISAQPVPSFSARQAPSLADLIRCQPPLNSGHLSSSPFPSSDQPPQELSPLTPSYPHRHADPSLLTPSPLHTLTPSPLTPSPPHRPADSSLLTPSPLHTLTPSQPTLADLAAAFNAHTLNIKEPPRARRPGTATPQHPSGAIHMLTSSQSHLFALVMCRSLASTVVDRRAERAQDRVARELARELGARRAARCDFSTPSPDDVILSRQQRGFGAGRKT